MMLFTLFVNDFTCCCVTIDFLSANDGPVNLLTAGTVCKRIVELEFGVKFGGPGVVTAGAGPTRSN